jgi:hypothetical protein
MQLKLDLLTLIQQAIPQVSGSDERGLLQAFLSRATDQTADVVVDVHPSDLKIVTNAWTIYAAGVKEDESPLACLGRPQDWGDPRWHHQRYVFEGFGYRNECHCWVDIPLDDKDHVNLFAQLLIQVTYPGLQPQLCGKDFLDEDDFWRDEWGPQPPYYDGPADEWDTHPVHDDWDRTDLETSHGFINARESE